MRKLLAILGSLVITASFSTAVTSCGTAKKSDKENGKNIFVPDDPQYKNSYESKYNYQSGPSTVDGTNTDNEFLTSFNVGMGSTYSAYNLKYDNDTKPVFYGDRANFLKTSDNKFAVKSWLNDKKQFQNVLCLKKDLSLYKNLSVNLSDNSKDYKEDSLISGTAKFEKYMLTNAISGKGMDGTNATEEVSSQRQYVPDAVWDSAIDGPYEMVNESTSKKKVSSDQVYFDVWNVLCEINTPNSKKAVGKHNLVLTYSFDYNGKHETVNKGVIVNVENHVYEDQNNDALKSGNIADNFGFNAGTYPTRSQKFWTDGEYKNLPNYDILAKMPATSWDIATKEYPILENYKYLAFKQKFISDDATLSVNKGNGIINFSTNKSTKSFKALVEIYGNQKLIATFSVYYNELGALPTSETYNSKADQINVDGKDVKDPKKIVDINGDGKLDASDWDINGDGIYTQEDYGSNLALNNGPDEIGPNKNYANFISNNPKQLQHLSNSLEPLEEAGGQLIRGNGFQEPTMNQLIQYSGRLIDKSYDKNSIPEEQQSIDQINGLPASMLGPDPDATRKKLIGQIKEKFKDYTDDYEYNLSMSTDADLNGTEFWSSTPKHKWEWNFDFTGLDEYMRIAAKNNMNEVLINPIDKGNFSFWYLKDDNKIGPLRTITTPRADWGSGQLTAFGKLYVDKIMTPMISQLSKHLSDIANDSAYKTNDGSGSQVKIFIQFDEQNEDYINYVMNAVNKAATGEKIYSFSYLGWRSNIGESKTEEAFWKNMEEDLLNKNISEVSLNYDWTINKWNVKARNEGLERFKGLVDQRKALGLSTSLYVAGYEYPGVYTGSDLSSAYWNMFFNYREGTNGFMKWGYDFLQNDYFDSCVIDANGANGGHAAGEKYLEYSGSGSQVHPSMRMMALIQAERYVNKLRQIRSDKYGFSEISKALAEKAINQLGIADYEKYIYANNDYKYNVNLSAPNKFEEPTGEGYDVTVSDQIYGVIKTVDSLD